MREEIAPPHQVVGGGTQGELPIHAPAAAVPQLPEQRDRLQPPKGLLNELPLLMTASIPGMSGCPRVDRAAAVPEFVLGHVGRDAQASDGRDPGARVVGFVGADGQAPRRQRQLAEHDDRGVAFGRPPGRRDGGVDDQAVAIVRQQMGEVAELGLRPTAFL